MEEQNLLVKSSLVPIFALVLSVLLLVADYFAGPFIQFPISYLIPIAYLSWFKGRRWGLALAIVMPLVRFYFNIVLWTVPWTTTEASINALIRILVLTSFAYIIDRTATQTRNLAREVSLLQGLLPICTFCKKIKDEKDQWQVLERYISDRTAALFTHGICPDCMRRHFPNVAANQQ